MGIADLRAFGGENDVAQQGQRRAEADRMAIHPADNRLFDIEHGIDDALGHARLVIEQVRVFGVALEMIEIAAG